MSPSRCPHSTLESRFHAHLLTTSERLHRLCLQSTPSSTTAFHMHGLGGGNVCFPLSRRWMTSQTASLSGEHLQLKCLSLSASIRLKRLSIERRAACPWDVENKMVMFNRIPTTLLCGCGLFRLLRISLDRLSTKSAKCALTSSGTSLCVSSNDFQHSDRVCSVCGEGRGARCCLALL